MAETPRLPERRLPSFSDQDSRPYSSKGSKKKVSASPQVGVRWQFGSKGATPAPSSSDDLNMVGPLGEILHHQLWRNPFIRGTLYRLRMSRYGACLAFVAALATLNGVCTVLFLEAVFGSGMTGPGSLNHDLGTRQLLLGASAIRGWGSHTQTERSLPRFIPTPKDKRWSVSNFFTPVKNAQLKFAKMLAKSSDTKWALPTVKSTKWGLSKSSQPLVIPDPPGKKMPLKIPDSLQHPNLNVVPNKSIVLDTTITDAKRVRGSSQENLKKDSVSLKWVPSNDEYRQELKSKWIIKKISSEPGVFLLQQKSDFSCALLLQDVCYVFTKGKSDLHFPNAGVWFANDLPKKLNEAVDLGASFKLSLSPSQISESPGLQRDLSKIDLSQDVCRSFSGPFSVSTGDSRDLSYMEQQGTGTTGKFISRADLVRYIENSTTKEQYFKNSNVKPINVGVIPRGGDSSETQFGLELVPFTETARHLLTEKKVIDKKGSPERIKRGPEDMTVFFPRDRSVESHWTSGMSRLILGTQTGIKGGKVQAKPVCFHNVAFVLNSRHLNQTADLLRKRGYRAVSKVLLKKKGNSKGKPDINRFEDLALPEFDDAPLLGVGGGAEGEGEGEANQVTLYDGNQSIENLKELSKGIQSMFPNMEVNTAQFSKMGLAEQIRTMQRTALLVAMYSPPLRNIVFMPRGSVVVVLFPYKYYNNVYQNIAQKSGIHYFSWENMHLGRSHYTDNCMIEKGFAKLTKSACLKQTGCVNCAINKSVTSVKVMEVTEVLDLAKPVVENLLVEQQKTKKGKTA